MKALYGIEKLNTATGTYEPSDEEFYTERRKAAYRMIALNSRVPFSAQQMFRVIVIENAE